MAWPKEVIGRSMFVIGVNTDLGDYYNYDRELVRDLATKYEKSADKLIRNYQSEDPTPRKRWNDFMYSNRRLRDDAKVSLERIIVHEVTHLKNGGNIRREQTLQGSSSYELKTHGNEEPTIKATNDFMFKYYGEAPRYEVEHSEELKSKVLTPNQMGLKQ